MPVNTERWTVPTAILQHLGTCWLACMMIALGSCQGSIVEPREDDHGPTQEDEKV